MKKIAIFMVITMLAASTAFAQPIKEQREAELRMQQERPNRQEKQEKGERRGNMLRNDQQKPRQDHQYPGNSVSVEGTLKLEKGFVAVQSGETVYLVPMLNRYIGFIDGLKEGQKVSVEGREHKKMIQPLKVTIGEKSYDFMAPPRGSGFIHNDKKDKYDKHHNQRYDNRKHDKKFEKNKFDNDKKRRYDKGGRK